MSAFRPHWSLVVAGLTLAGAVCMQAMGLMREPRAPRPAHLAQDIPHEIAGWSGRDVPLGPNEFIAGEVEKILRYDEVLHREYRRGEYSFGVYVAYWGEGKMPSQLVASHTPDRCWTENGWRCLDMKFGQSFTVKGEALLPAEWRVFVPPAQNQPTYVIYWHLNGGELYDYGHRFNSVPDPVRWWRDVVRQAFAGNREQYFIRLTSNRPLEELWADPGFSAVVQGLARLGLATSPVLSPASS